MWTQVAKGEPARLTQKRAVETGPQGGSGDGLGTSQQPLFHCVMGYLPLRKALFQTEGISQTKSEVMVLLNSLEAHVI